MAKFKTRFAADRFFYVRGTLRAPNDENILAVQFVYGLDEESAPIVARLMVTIQGANRRLFKSPLPLGYIMWVAKRILEGSKKSPEELLCIAYGTLDVEQEIGEHRQYSEKIVDRGRQEVYDLLFGFCHTDSCR